jgi:hypothetical protein
VLLAVWIALGIAALAIAGAGVSAGRSALAAVRDLRRFRGSVSTELGDLTGRVERLSERAEHTPTRRTDLDRSLARLRASLAQLAVLRTALDEATDAPGRLIALYPRKRA